MVLKKTAMCCDRTVKNEMKCCWNLIKPEWYALWWHDGSERCGDGMIRSVWIGTLWNVESSFPSKRNNLLSIMGDFVLCKFSLLKYKDGHSISDHEKARSKQIDCTIHKCLVNGISISHSVSVLVVWMGIGKRQEVMASLSSFWVIYTLRPEDRWQTAYLR